MEATNLAPALWNAIAEMVRKATTVPRETYFVRVTKTDKKQRLIYTEEFGDIGIPLVMFTLGHTYYDTQADGSVLKRGTDYETNDAHQTKIVMPKVGELVVIIDPEGAKVNPYCVGIVQSIGHWEAASGS